MLERIRAVLGSVFGTDALNHEHEQFRAQMSEIERRHLELDALTAELEARVAVLEEEHRADAVG